jgi:hypothetical protein
MRPTGYAIAKPAVGFKQKNALRLSEGRFYMILKNQQL